MGEHKRAARSQRRATFLIVFNGVSTWFQYGFLGGFLDGFLSGFLDAFLMLFQLHFAT
jgi:hypothetical protein